MRGHSALQKEFLADLLPSSGKHGNISEVEAFDVRGEKETISIQPQTPKACIIQARIYKWKWYHTLFIERCVPSEEVVVWF